MHVTDAVIFAVLWVAFMAYGRWTVRRPYFQKEETVYDWEKEGL